MNSREPPVSSVVFVHFEVADVLDERLLVGLRKERLDMGTEYA